MKRSENFNATVVGRENVTPEILILRVMPDSGVPDFCPGQYMALGVCECDTEGGSCEDGRCHYEPEFRAGKLVKRAYSMASSPSNRDYLEFLIGVIPAGSFTTRIAKLDKGARMFAAPKVVGDLTLRDVPGQANLILFATGSGVAPFVSMLRDESTWRSGRRISLAHGVRYAEDLSYRHEMESLARRNSDFQYIPVVSRERDSVLQKGHVQDLILRERISPNPGQDHVFLCGNPEMVDDMQALLENLGFVSHGRNQSGNIHVEKYWS